RVALAGASRGDRAALPARVQPGRDRAGARPATWHGQLAAAPGTRCARVTARRGGARMSQNAKHALREFRAPDEGGANRRAWPVVREAYLEREPAPRAARTRARLALSPLLAVIAAGLVLSPAGATVGRLITKALGVRHAAPMLSS